MARLTLLSITCCTIRNCGPNVRRDFVKECLDVGHGVEMGSFCVFLISDNRIGGEYESSRRVGLSADLPTKAGPLLRRAFGETNPLYEEQTKSRQAWTSCRWKNISGFLRHGGHGVSPFIDRCTGVLCMELVCFCDG